MKCYVTSSYLGLSYRNPYVTRQTDNKKGVGIGSIGLLAMVFHPNYLVPIDNRNFPEPII